MPTLLGRLDSTCVLVAKLPKYGGKFEHVITLTFQEIEANKLNSKPIEIGFTRFGI